MQNELAALQEILRSHSSFILIIAKNQDLDTMAAALGFFLSLQAAGKSIDLICESEPTVRDSHLVGLDQIKKEVGGQNLVITVNVEGDVVDKVTSAVEGGKLSLTIIPKNGRQPLTSKDIVFGSSGGSNKPILVVGGATTSDLGKSLPGDGAIVNISNLKGSFGQINLIDENSSISELVVAIIQELKLPLDEDIASNLMQGIEDATNNFQSPGMTADTFEALAALYRAGARHSLKAEERTATIIDNTPIIEERQVEDQKDIAAIETELAAMTQVQDDWLKPKIYNSGSDK